MSDRNKEIAAFAIASVLVAAATWLVLSAMSSFIHLEWRFVTSTALGRFVFLTIWLWLNVAMLKHGGDETP